MYLLLADDLTGGNDAGIQFAKRGIAARLALAADCVSMPDVLPDALAAASRVQGQLLVVNSNTRNMPAAAAAQRLSSCIAALREAAPPRPAMVFKKIDSTLRGNLGAEMEAIMDGFGFGVAFLAASYPQQGRTVVDGSLLVDRIPLHLTGFADDPLTPARESSIAAVVGGQSRRKIGFVSLAVLAAGKDAFSRRVRELIEDGAECLIFDAETADHLALVADVGLSMHNRPLFIGSAGLAEALAVHLSPDAPAHGTAATPDLATASAERVFFVCGSAHHATHRQTAVLEQAGVPVLRMPENVLENPGAAEVVCDAAMRALERGSAALAAPLGRIGGAGSMVEGLALSDALSAMVVSVLGGLFAAPRSTALVMTGGETAYAVLKRLGNCLSLHTELLPGIALCVVRGGPWDGLRVVTKAGGFGSPGTLLELVTLLRQRETA